MGFDGDRHPFLLVGAVSGVASCMQAGRGRNGRLALQLHGWRASSNFQLQTLRQPHNTLAPKKPANFNFSFSSFFCTMRFVLKASSFTSPPGASWGVNSNKAGRRARDRGAVAEYSQSPALRAPAPLYLAQPQRPAPAPRFPFSLLSFLQPSSLSCRLFSSYFRLITYVLLILIDILSYWWIPLHISNLCAHSHLQGRRKLDFPYSR